jgi:hypothetical protein
MCRQLNKQLTKFLQRNQEPPAEPENGGSSGSSGSSLSSVSSGGGPPQGSKARRQAGLAAAQEHALLVRECIAVCEAELAARGLSVS